MIASKVGSSGNLPAFLTYLQDPRHALLKVLPVAAVFRTFGDGENLRIGTVRVAGVALAGYLAVTAVSHLGHEELRGAEVASLLIGNAIVTPSLPHGPRNPITPVLVHVAMNAATVVHGMESAVQLPPHA